MTPPVTAAVALLGIWALMMVWATTTAATAQSQADGQSERTGPESQRDQCDGIDSERSFHAGDD